MEKFRVVSFDMDGTLIKETCWDILHGYFKIDLHTSQRYIEDYINGEISFQELVEREIELWKKDGKLPHIGEVKKALERYTLVKNAKTTMSTLRDMGYITSLVTHGLDILANNIKAELKIDHVFANTLETDAHGYLTGNQFNKVCLGKKNEVLEQLSYQLKIPLSLFVAVGDTKYDLSMFHDVGLRIAFNPKHVEIRRAADIIIEEEDLSQILKFL